jgi:hypothetical protein
MSPDFEIELFNRILDPVMQCFTPEAASRLMSLQADPEAQQHIDELAEKCNEGLLTAQEREMYEAYVSAGNVVAVLQAKARAMVGGRWHSKESSRPHL